MSTVYQNQDEAWSFIQGCIDLDRKAFLQSAMASAIHMGVKGAYKEKTKTHFDLLFYIHVMDGMFDKREALVGILTGRAEDFLMLPDDI